MTETQIAPYGSWKSPVTAEMLVAGGVRLRAGRSLMGAMSIGARGGRRRAGGKSWCAARLTAR